MRNLLYSCALACAVTTLALGQGTYNYAPNMLNVPYLTQQGDITLGLGFAGGTPLRSMELQGAFSPVKRLAVMANYMNARDARVRAGTEMGTDYYLWETGLGIYNQLPRGLVSLFAGYGTGTLFSNFGGPDQNRDASLHFKRWFLQPGMMYRNGHFTTAFACRLSRLHFDQGKIAFAISQQQLAHFQSIEESTPMLLPEIGLQAGVNLAFLTLSLNFATIYPDTEKWNFTRMTTAIMLTSNFGVKRKKTVE